MNSGDTLRIDCTVNPGDLDRIVEIHLAAFPGYFLSLMGRSFVRQYYQAVLEYPRAITLVARRDGDLAGFATGFGDPQAFYAHYRARRWRMLGTVLAAAAIRPRLVPRIYRNLRRVSVAGGNPSEAELSSIAVLPDQAGSGIGSHLLAAFVEAAAGERYSGISLTTDVGANEHVIAFYRKRGFTVEEQFPQGDRPMIRLRLMLGDRPRLPEP